MQGGVLWYPDNSCNANRQLDTLTSKSPQHWAKKSNASPHFNTPISPSFVDVEATSSIHKRVIKNFQKPVDRRYFNAAGVGLKFGEDVVRERCHHPLSYRSANMRGLFSSAEVIGRPTRRRNLELRTNRSVDLSFLHDAPLPYSYLKEPTESKMAVKSQKSPASAQKLTARKSVSLSSSNKTTSSTKLSPLKLPSPKTAPCLGSRSPKTPEDESWDEHLIKSLSANTARWILRSRNMDCEVRSRLEPLLDAEHGRMDPAQMVDLVGDDRDDSVEKAADEKPRQSVWIKEKDRALEMVKQIDLSSAHNVAADHKEHDVAFYRLPLSSHHVKKSRVIEDNIEACNSTAANISVVPYMPPPMKTLSDVIGKDVGDKIYRTSNQFEQEWLLGSSPVHQTNSNEILMNSSESYRKILRSETPKRPEKWCCAGPETGQMVDEKEASRKKKLKVRKGMRRWNALPELIEDSMTTLNNPLYSAEVVQLKPAKEIELRKTTLVDIMTEWRSQWQLDMRYSTATADDLIRDMADLHVDTRLRAIVTCARVIEYASESADGATDSSRSRLLPSKLFVALQRSLADSNARVSHAAAIALYVLGSPSPEAESVLRVCVEEAACVDRWSAVRCLVYYGECDSHVVGALIERLLSSETAEGQPQVNEHLVQLSKTSSLVHSMLGEHLNSGSWWHRVVACHMMLRLHGETNQDLVEKLKDLMWSDWHQEVRAAAALALSSTGHGLVVHDSLLEKLTGNFNEIVRADAVGKLGRLGIMTAKMLALFVECFNDEHATVRLETCSACSSLKLRDEQVISELIKLAQDEPIHRVKAAAIQALANIGIVTLPIRNTLLWAFRFENDIAVRAEACRAIVKLRLQGHDIVQMLQECYLVESNTIIKREITAALSQYGVSPNEDLPMVQEMKKAVHKLCSSDIIIAQLMENEEKLGKDVSCYKKWQENRAKVATSLPSIPDAEKLASQLEIDDDDDDLGWDGSTSSMDREISNIVMSASFMKADEEAELGDEESIASGRKSVVPPRSSDLLDQPAMERAESALEEVQMVLRSERSDSQQSIIETILVVDDILDLAGQDRKLKTMKKLEHENVKDDGIDDDFLSDDNSIIF